MLTARIISPLTSCCRFNGSPLPTFKIEPILAAARILALKFTDADRQTQELLQLIETNSVRGINIVEHLFSFANKSDREFSAIQIDRILSKIAIWAKATFPKSIKICLDLPDKETIARVLGNASQLEQVLQHLCVNSRNAMVDGGILRICLEGELKNPQCNYGDRSSKTDLKQYTVITVWDNGIGMPRSLKNQIFKMMADPQKIPPAKKAGLFTVINIVKNHGGFIKIQSELGKGTLFKIYLPVAETKLDRSAGELNLSHFNYSEV